MKVLDRIEVEEIELAKLKPWSRNPRSISEEARAGLRASLQRFGLVEPVVVNRRGKRLIDWVIVGGESGPDARPMHPDWARSLRDQCGWACVPFFFKQWGEWAIGESRHFAERNTRAVLFSAQPGAPSQLMARVGKKRAGRLLDGREHSEFPEMLS